MRYEARATVYDVLDQIQVSLVVYCKGDQDDGPPAAVYTFGRQYPGRGEFDPRRWLLQALEETLSDLQESEKRRATLDALTLGLHTITDVADSAPSGND